MSRRKQKFPSHNTGECDNVQCQELRHELLPSPVDSDTRSHTESSDGELNLSDSFVETPSQYQISAMEAKESLDESSQHQRSTTADVITFTSNESVVVFDETAEKEPSDRLLIVEEPSSFSTPVLKDGDDSPFGYAAYENQISSAKNDVYKLESSATNSVFSEASATSITRNSSKHLNGYRAERKVKNSDRIKSNDFKCPVCSENFISKRSFNSHILVHCQLVNTRASIKRSLEEASCSSLEKRKNQTELLIKTEVSDPHFPLDLSCKRNGSSELLSALSPCNFFKSEHLKGSSSPELETSQNSSYLSDRSPMEDENENLVNEAREHEKAFFDNSQNEMFLTEDSTGLEPPTALPMFHSGGISRRVRVSSDEGSPMVYRIKTHAEQIFISRIIGTNEETGDKIELYKCFMCDLSFPSVSKIQLHLTHHKQRFVCCKCSFSCDSRVEFSQHVQRKHITNESNSNRLCPRSASDSGEDSTNAENTVTVAALLSALHNNSGDRNNFYDRIDEGRAFTKMEDESRQEDMFPASPTSEAPMEDVSGGGASGDMFKMFSCRFCGKKFDRAFSCNRHERVHTGFKPCFCRICGRGFSEPRNLRHHVIRFHSDGSLRHLIKRDRKKRKGEESPPPPNHSDSILLHKEMGGIPFAHISSTSLTGGPDNMNDSAADQFLSNGLVLEQNGNNPYTNSLTKMFAATLDRKRK